ncbi:MAG: PAS domain S-box protein [Trebonia sp.]
MNDDMSVTQSKTETDVASVMADSIGTIVYWSAAAARLFGYDRQDVIGRSLDVIVPENYRDAHWTAFHAVMAGGPGKLDGASAHIPVRCADGRVRTFPGRFGFIRDPHGNVCAASATYRDRDGEAAPFSPVVSDTSVEGP